MYSGNSSFLEFFIVSIPRQIKQPCDDNRVRMRIWISGKHLHTEKEQTYLKNAETFFLVVLPWMHIMPIKFKLTVIIHSSPSKQTQHPSSFTVFAQLMQTAHRTQKTWQQKQQQRDSGHQCRMATAVPPPHCTSHPTIGIPPRVCTPLGLVCLPGVCAHIQCKLR